MGQCPIPRDCKVCFYCFISLDFLKVKKYLLFCVYLFLSIGVFPIASRTRRNAVFSAQSSAQALQAVVVGRWWGINDRGPLRRAGNRGRIGEGATGQQQGFFAGVVLANAVIACSQPPVGVVALAAGFELDTARENRLRFWWTCGGKGGGIGIWKWRGRGGGRGRGNNGTDAACRGFCGLLGGRFGAADAVGQSGIGQRAKGAQTNRCGSDKPNEAGHLARLFGVDLSAFVKLECLLAVAPRAFVQTLGVKQAAADVVPFVDDSHMRGGNAPDV